MVFTVLAIAATACKKKTEEVPSKTYSISGTYYDTDGETPKPNTELLLVPVSVDYFDPKEIKDFEQSCITDENGNYEFVYSEMKVSEKAEFAIGELIGHQLAAPFLLTAIPVDENIERDICNCGYGILFISFTGNLLETDTLYTRLQPNNPNPTLFTYPWESQIIKFNWNKEYTETGEWTYAVIGYEQNNAVDVSQRKGSLNEDFKDQIFRFTIRGFPYTDTLVIDVKK